MKDFDLMAILLNAEFSAMLLHGVKTTLLIAAGSWTLVALAVRGVSVVRPAADAQSIVLPIATDRPIPARPIP